MNITPHNSLAAAALAGVSQLAVTLHDRRVGTLAETSEGFVAFEYDSAWLAQGFSISPLSLPLQAGVFVPERRVFEGLFGVFADCLPDGWGALLMSRMLQKCGVDPYSVTPLTQLAIVGQGGRGALRFQPEIPSVDEATVEDLDAFSEMCQELLAGKPVDDLDEAFAAGGSSGGARPKAYLERDGVQWLVKFPSSIDPAEVGKMEQAYAQAARDCGIDMPNTCLLPSKRCGGYFATERFDRDSDGEGVHAITASGLLEVSHRVPALDYKHLFQATQMLTHDQSQLWELFRRMCFNVFAHNQDDHSNNFAWLCRDGLWELSPAYDLTYSTSFGGEHATTVNGKGNPTMNDVLVLAEQLGLDGMKARSLAREIDARCVTLLESVGHAPA